MTSKEIRKKIIENDLSRVITTREVLRRPSIYDSVVEVVLNESIITKTKKAPRTVGTALRRKIRDEALGRTRNRDMERSMRSKG